MITLHVAGCALCGTASDVVFALASSYVFLDGLAVSGEQSVLR